MPDLSEIGSSPHKAVKLGGIVPGLRRRLGGSSLYHRQESASPGPPAPAAKAAAGRIEGGPKKVQKNKVPMVDDKTWIFS